VNGVLMAGFVTPAFWVGILLILAFAVSVHAFPASGYVSFRADPLGHVRSLVLPAATLVISQVALYYRYLQQGLREAMASQYVRTARAKGLPESRVIFGHALKLGILPVVSYLGPAVARIVMGSIVIEQIFAIPGLGRHLVSAAFNRDYTLVLGIVVFYAGFLMVLNLLVDVAYAWLDPRVELA
jgi:oligopeptide transport system permease protein